jgi:hypothetical protein
MMIRENSYNQRDNEIMSCANVVVGVFPVVQNHPAYAGRSP